MASGEADELRRRHLAYFLALAEESTVPPVDTRLAAWPAMIEEERDNLRAAWAWAMRAAGPGDDQALRLTAALADFWLMGSRMQEGRQRLEAALSRSETRGTPRAAALLSLAQLTFYTADPRDAQRLAEESLALSRELGDTRAIAGSLVALASFAAQFGNYDGALAMAEEAVMRARESGDRRSIANSVGLVAWIARLQGDYAQAQVLCEEALALWRSIGHQMGTADALEELGELARLRGDYAGAGDWLDQALAVSRKVGYTHVTYVALYSLGCVHLQQGRVARAAACAREALMLNKEARFGGATAALAFALAGGVAVAAGASARGVRLLAIAHALLEANNEVPDPLNRATYDRDVAASKEALSGSEWAEAWAAGRGLSLEEALRYALEETVPDA